MISYNSRYRKALKKKDPERFKTYQAKHRLREARRREDLRKELQKKSPVKRQKRNMKQYWNSQEKDKESTDFGKNLPRMKQAITDK